MDTTTVYRDEAVSRCLMSHIVWTVPRVYRDGAVSRCLMSHILFHGAPRAVFLNRRAAARYRALA
jgi:hypothetical protein